jgi:hypothetical protein
VTTKGFPGDDARVAMEERLAAYEPFLAEIESKLL